MGVCLEIIPNSDEPILLNDTVVVSECDDLTACILEARVSSATEALTTFEYVPDRQRCAHGKVVDYLPRAIGRIVVDANYFSRCPWGHLRSQESAEA